MQIEKQKTDTIVEEMVCEKRGHKIKYMPILEFKQYHEKLFSDSMAVILSVIVTNQGANVGELLKLKMGHCTRCGKTQIKGSKKLYMMFAKEISSKEKKNHKLGIA